MGGCRRWLGLCLLLALAGPGEALQNVTAQLFGAEAYGTLAAFGDFNSDKQTDLFVLRGGECAGGGSGAAVATGVGLEEGGSAAGWALSQESPRSALGVFPGGVRSACRSGVLLVTFRDLGGERGRRAATNGRGAVRPGGTPARASEVPFCLGVPSWSVFFKRRPLLA